jgi:trk system potassium uptake protein TrkH
MFLYRDIAKILSKYLFYLAAVLTLPLFVALYYEHLFPHLHPQPPSTNAFAFTLLSALCLSLLLRFLGKGSSGQLYRRESILLVVLIWVVTSCVSALPFYFSRTLTHPVDAYFEAISGLTTTGSTLLSAKAYNPETGAEIPIHITNPRVPDKTYTYYGTVPPVRDPQTHLIIHSGIEAVSKGVLFWRSLLQWIGGMGIVVIFLNILPALGVGGKFLYQAESTGPIKEGLAPRIQDTVSQLWKLYLFLTLLEISLLVWTNRELPLFDAICISLSNISTGGFSVRNDSIAAYQSPITEWIVLLFMIAGSINFSLYFHALRFKFYRIYVPDFFLFLAVALIGCLAVSGFLFDHLSTAEALRQGFFQALSMQTSTGFTTANYDTWPFPSQMIMLLLMFVGGMSGSTAGGIKTSRFYILYKILTHRLESLYRPYSVRKLYIGKSEVDEKNGQTVLAFFCIVAFFAVLGTALYILDQIDPETALGLMACMVNNVGLAFRAAGPTDSLCFLSPFAKLLSTFWMLLGRLEFYVVLLLFLPAYWKGR